MRGESYAVNKGREMMSRSAHMFLSKKKQVAGMAVGAIAMLAMAVPALTEEDDAEAIKKDEVFKVTTAIHVDGSSALVSFDISWVDPVRKRYYLAERSNNQIDVVNTSDNSITHFARGIFAGVVLTGSPPAANNDLSGPDGLLTANNHTELWVGDAPNTTFNFGKVWVLSALDGSVSTKPPANPIKIPNPVTKKDSTTRADELCYDPKENLIM